MQDTIEHDWLSEECWCEPVLIWESEDGGIQIWSHREDEDGGWVPPEVVAEAIVEAKWAEG